MTKTCKLTSNISNQVCLHPPPQDSVRLQKQQEGKNVCCSLTNQQCCCSVRKTLHSTRLICSLYKIFWGTWQDWTNLSDMAQHCRSVFPGFLIKWIRSRDMQLKLHKLTVRKLRIWGKWSFWMRSYKKFHRIFQKQQCVTINTMNVQDHKFPQITLSCN